MLLPAESPWPHDAAAADACAAALRTLRGAPAPPAQLPGWVSLTAGEYGRAVRELTALLAAAESVLARAAG